MEGLPRYSDLFSHQQNEKLQPPHEIATKSKLSWPSRSLSVLPLELQLQILRFLDYQSLRNLSQTSRQFRLLLAYTISRDIIRESLLALERDPEQRISLLVKPNRLPCHHCLRVLRVNGHFADPDTYSSASQELGTSHAESHSCMSCRFRFHLLTGDGQSELFVYRGKCWLACASCTQVKLYLASNTSMKGAWEMSRRCVNCAKIRQREERSDLGAKHCVRKQTAVDVQQPAMIGSDSEKLAVDFRKTDEKSFGSRMWLSLKTLLRTTR